MHIQTVNIQGFKSYRKQDFQQEFDPQLNVIVGRNGSGKSNFFAAVSFVLSEKYSRLQAEQRQALLHEGTGRGAMTASVEIVFDNSDNRLPVTEEEVRIKRTIGLKKDEFKINDKSATARDVSNLLESAGFSSSNPYYIVEQGKVNRLTTMKDNERLELLKEVAGTRVYDDKKNESLKILQQQEAKKKSIDDTIEYVKERLNELKSEEKELKSFRKYDSERRMLEYNIYNMQLQEAIAQIDLIDDKRSSAYTKTSLINDQRLDIQIQLRQLERAIGDKKIQLISKRKQRENDEEERQSMLREITKLKLDIEDINQIQRSGDRIRQDTENDLRSIDKDIEHTESDLSKLEVAHKREQDRERQLRSTIDDAKRKQNALFAKSGRSDQFGSKQERDAYLETEIKKRTDQIQDSTAKINRLKKAIASIKSKMRNNVDESDQTQKTIKHNQAEIKNLQTQLSKLRERRDSKVNERKLQQKKLYETIKEIEVLSSTFQKQKDFLETTRSRDISKGIAVVEDIVRQRRINGYHGPVIDLISVNKRYHLAAEATAGNSLFHLVVDNSSVAKQIIEIMNNTRQRGRITFIPLEELNPKSIKLNLPDAEAVHLANRVDTDPKFSKLVKQIFGRTYVAQSLETASQVAKGYHVNCVTLEGDKVDKKGTLQGGYVEAKRVGRLQAQRNLNEARENRDFAQENKLKSDAILSELDREINNVESEITKVEMEIRTHQNSINGANQKVKQLQQSDLEMKDTLPRTETALAEYEKNVDNLKKDIETFKRELQTAFTSGLDQREEVELSRLVSEIARQSTEADKLEQTIVEMEAKIDSLRYKLRSNLMPRRQDLERRVQQTLNPTEALGDNQLTATGEETPAEKEKRLNQLEREIDECNSRIDAVDTELEELQNSVSSEETSTEKKRQALETKLAKLQEKDTSLEKLLNERKIFLEKQEESIRAIRELGSIPQDHERFADQSGKELLDRLHKVKEKLKKYQHVNKKALDQLEEYKVKLRDFSKKKKELDQEDKAIRDLVKILDRRKHEVIARTFKQVSEHFAEMFRRMVPGGSAELTLSKAGRGEEDMEDEEENTEHYSGVSIKTRFPGSGEEQLMQQLSGGQKTVVALALIFAIQKCDPAPFYLLDEIDSALDPTYRKAIAELIQQQAQDSNIQFIVTTFKTELVHAAKQHFGIKFQNKVSQISSISKSKSLSILAEEEKALAAE